MNDKWVKNIAEMHEKFGVNEVVDEMDHETLRNFLEFRLMQIKEEYDELEEAINTNNPEEVVDALIDICVFAIGTMDSFGIKACKAWNEVFKANMAKNVGIKEGRPNPFGLPDLIKPEGWVAPSHEGNHGKLLDIMDNKNV